LSAAALDAVLDAALDGVLSAATAGMAGMAGMARNMMVAMLRVRRGVSFMGDILWEEESKRAG